MPLKYKIDENYFHSIDDEHKAYWLGFIYADGYLNINSNVFGIELNCEDENHLHKFNNDISSNRPIYTYHKNSTFGSQVNCRWTCSNKTLYHDLMSHGITSTKSYDGEFPIINDCKHIKHVIRGIFDGDGSITCKKGLIGYLTGAISICNTKETLEYIEDFSGFSWDWSQRYPDKNINNYQIACGNQENVVRFLNLIYKNANIYLDRKYKKYQEFINSRKLVDNNHLTNHNFNNIRSDNTSGATGVNWQNNIQKWVARIQIDGKLINLGCFTNFNDAVQARKNAEKKYLSQFWLKEGDEIAL